MIGYASQQINKVVRRSFGLEFRSDWKIIGVNGDGEVDLEIGKLPQIIARSSLWLPKWFDEQEIAAHISFNGRNVVYSVNFEEEIRKYKEIYEKERPGKVSLQRMEDNKFQEYVRVYGREFI